LRYPIHLNRILQGRTLRDGANLGYIPVSGMASSSLAVIAGSGPLAGNIVIQSSNGSLILLDPHSGNYVQISSGADNGFTFGFDSTDGSLLVPQYDGAIYRLTCGMGCNFIHGGISQWYQNPTCP
jgi:hypothetical protein